MGQGGIAMSEDVLFEIEDDIAIITLNRPQKLNAVTPEMADAIVAAVRECNDSDTIRCVIVTGAGERAFCAGSCQAACGARSRQDDQFLTRAAE
eukprot:gene6269-biopygen5327